MVFQISVYTYLPFNLSFSPGTSAYLLFQACNSVVKSFVKTTLLKFFAFFKTYFSFLYSHFLIPQTVFMLILMSLVIYYDLFSFGLPIFPSAVIYRTLLLNKPVSIVHLRFFLLFLNMLLNAIACSFFPLQMKLKLKLLIFKSMYSFHFRNSFLLAFPSCMLSCLLTVNCLSTVFSLSFAQNSCLWRGQWFTKYSILFPTVSLNIIKSLRKHIRTTQASMISLLKTFSSPSHFQLWAFPSRMWVMLTWQCEMDCSSMNLPRVPFSHRTFCYL